ncbi:tigger transposable element-derived protein 4-like, partial [Saccostrea echinata]|uniref:tigger transposable element-derived protein 4-like n=1 Tax=Saccostrea echinata TaxID=191078 RepID=UPI002A81247A
HVAKRKRTDLTLSTKYEIVKLLDQKVSQWEIGRQYGIVQSSISTIPKNRAKIKENYESCQGEHRVQEIARREKRCDTDAADRWITEVLPEIIRDYKAKDIYNADETGIYYRAIPDSTHTFKNEIASGSKKCKDHVTALVCANMSGDDKRKLLIIGESKDPRCFRGKSLPVVYKANKNSWMTGEIFSEWIREFYRDMCRKKRKVILLVDNCSAHPKESAELLSNVCLEFLPPNTTSMIQLCDQGIIRNMKCKYRSEVVKKIISDINDQSLSANDLAKRLTLFDAVHLLNKAWKSVTNSTIVNCFKKTGFCQEKSEDSEEADVPAGMTREEFEEFINHDNTLQCHHVPTDEDSWKTGSKRRRM